MTDKKPYLASLKGRGLHGTGATENIARQMVGAKGRRYMAVIEVEVHTIHDKPEQQVADLVVEQFWPVVDDNDLDEHLRNLTAVLHARRGTDDGDQEFEFDGPTPNLRDVLAAGQQHTSHPYIASGLSVDDDATCDVCGRREGAAQHLAAERGRRAGVEEERPPRQVVSDLLELIDDNPVSDAEWEAWTDDDVAAVVAYAQALHLHASDNDVAVELPDCPAVLEHRALAEAPDGEGDRDAQLAHNHDADTDCDAGCPVTDAADTLLTT